MGLAVSLKVFFFIKICIFNEFLNIESNPFVWTFQIEIPLSVAPNKINDSNWSIWSIILSGGNSNYILLLHLKIEFLNWIERFTLSDPKFRFGIWSIWKFLCVLINSLILVIYKLCRPPKSIEWDFDVFQMIQMKK